MNYDDNDPTFRARFLEPKFEPETIVQLIVGKFTRKIDKSILGNITSTLSKFEYDFIAR